ncbi:hypothetical protein NQ318_000132, partial [Aromia moschata]
MNRICFLFRPDARHLTSGTTARFRSVPFALCAKNDDNSKVHRARRICDWFNEHLRTLLHLDWPAKSPDLSPIDNLWYMLEQRVKRRNQHPRNLVDLRDQILSEWPKLDETYLHNLVDSLLNRIQA